MINYIFIQMVYFTRIGDFTWRASDSEELETDIYIFKFQ